jgi:hypothetical protein
LIPLKKKLVAADVQSIFFHESKKMKYSKEFFVFASKCILDWCEVFLSHATSLGCLCFVLIEVANADCQFGHVYTLDGIITFVTWLYIFSYCLLNDRKWILDPCNAF